jgi:hypothetical protein
MQDVNEASQSPTGRRDDPVPRLFMPNPPSKPSGAGCGDEPGILEPLHVGENPVINPSLAYSIVL